MDTQAEAGRNSIDYTAVAPNLIATIWPCVWEMIGRAIEGDHHEVDLGLVMHRLQSGYMQMWLVVDKEAEDAIIGVVVTEITGKVLGATCSIVILAGEQFPRWRHLIENIEDWSKSQGADEMTFRCRPGFEPLMKEYGYRRSHVILRKNLATEN